MRTSSRLAGAPLLPALLALLPLSALSVAAPTYEIVAEKDQAAPAPGGGTDSTFNDFNSLGAISSNGDITTGGLADPGFLGAFWYRGGGSTTVELLARVDESAPGVAPAANFSSIAAPLTPLGTPNANGDVAFLGGIPGTITSGTDLGIWLGTPGSLTLVALGNEAAAVIGGGVLYEEIHRPVLSDSGSLAFRTELQGTGVSGSNKFAIYAGTPGSLTLVAREGSAAPGSPGGGDFSTLYDPLIDSSGNVCFSAQTTSESGIWAGPPGSILPLVVQGDPAPGLTAGTTFGAFDGPGALPAWNGSQIAFNSSLFDNGTFRVGTWAGTPGNLTFIAATGLTAPGLSAPILPTNGMIGKPVISASGHLAFRAKLDPADPGVTSSDDEVIFYGPIGNVQPLLREGDTMPGTSRTLSSLGVFDAFEMGPDGSLAFEVSTSPGVFQGEIWVARPDSTIVPLALHDQIISAGGQDWQIDGADFANSGQVSFNIDRTGRNGSDGRPSAFGPGGTFVFMCNMAPTAGGSNRQVLLLANLDGSTPLVPPTISILKGVPGANDVRIQVETVTGQDYSVFRYTTFPDTASKISGPTAGTGGILNVDDAGALLDPSHFYYAETE